MKLRITVDGKAYEVDVEVAEDDRPQNGGFSGYYAPSSPVSIPSPVVPPPLNAPAPSSGAPEDKICRSPIAGIVRRINAQVGQHIEVNDPLMVLEAMKMETNITSPVKGTIKTINASADEGVQINQVLVEFE